ncbi:hypothetical protein C0Q70_12259 [Pomacea canaliculata]|uniref:Uncharacterized protein n=1 Tax=Pomacea canaliculata TaxID=400727 RepID=A0A2T7P107_POMCA|nr:hypothetical protein C0Q70_12259 [Pomacea canaliculata]
MRTGMSRVVSDMGGETGNQVLASELRDEPVRCPCSGAHFPQYLVIPHSKEGGGRCNWVVRLQHSTAAATYVYRNTRIQPRFVAPASRELGINKRMPVNNKDVRRQNMALVPGIVTTAVVILITCQRANSVPRHVRDDTSCTVQHQAVTAVSHTSITFNATRDMAGTLVCSEVFSNGTVVSANCTQDIAYPLQVDKVNVTINLENWTFTAEVVTSRVFSSLSRYSMFINEVNIDIYQQYYVGPIEIASKPSFELYTNSTTGLEYHRGTVTTSWSLPSKRGDYYYTLLFVPHWTTSNFILKKVSKRLFASGLLKILEPSPPETNCSLTYVPEVGQWTACAAQCRWGVRQAGCSGSREMTS